ncbi:efflux transporter outer membrane subunit [Burkholderia perseverans]|uniref:efflux transporter outer membrane subunit n=1 Tax=Burkholderia perseverans TaxID=2615214 RepID=UPI001FEF3184|nr:efflux transporter outer membrane subunit [Burkholderia perseverans]
MNAIPSTPGRRALRALGIPTLLGALLVLAGCSLAPDYHAPAAPVSAAYRETTPADTTLGSWKPAQPAEGAARGAWWKVFADPALDALETRALAANQDMKAAAARLAEARALDRQARAGLFPTLDAGFGPTRQLQSAVSQFRPDGTAIPQQTLWRAQASAAYEVDLFGRVASTIDAAHADTQRGEALYRSVLLALQADVAQHYFALRELDAEAEVFTQAVALRERALTLITQRYAAGDVTELDLARARAELASAKADALAVTRSRATAEHALAVLLGEPPAAFTFAAAPLRPVELRIPPGLPSSLLERRPDIAAAERAMAAANARIGVARAAFFPSLALTGTAGFEAATLGDLFRWSSRAFLLGPLAGTALNVPIFDGGARRGNLERSRAAYDEAVAQYRQQVLGAFREVEDGLSDMRLLADQTRAQDEAVAASQRAADLAQRQYAEGEVSYLDVIDAQRGVLQARRAAAQTRGVQAAATVSLIRALGGGWDEAAPDASVAAAEAPRLASRGGAID